jgi:hypothetical protein
VVASIPGGVATAPAAGVDRRQEGGKGGSVALEEGHGQGRERKGARHRAAAFICAAGGRGRRGGSGVATAWKRETGGEGGASDAVDGQHRPMVDNRGRVAHTRGVVPSRGGRAVMSGPHLQFQAAINLLQNHIQTDSNYSNFDHLKNGLPELKKFE